MSLRPALSASRALCTDAPLDVAVLGQFKSGKSSLLNAVLGEAIFPVGVVPVTAVVTRVSGGSNQFALITYLNGSTERVGLDRLAEFVSEKGNPQNRLAVAVVDVFTPSMHLWPGLRLVDTPGLGSVWLHNSKTTESWMPNVAIALIVISVERPLSDDDRRLLKVAKTTAARVVVVVNKVDLVSADELAEVSAFMERTLQAEFGESMEVLAFSSRVDSDRWIRQLRERVIEPVAGKVADVRREALDLKLRELVRCCRGYLQLGLDVAERTDAERDRLRAAVLDESVHASVIRDELRQAEKRISCDSEAAFETALLGRDREIRDRLTSDLGVELPTWKGNLAEQTNRYQAWMKARLKSELQPLSDTVAAELARQQLNHAETRIARVVEAFRDRIGRNIQKAIGIDVSPANWHAMPPALSTLPIAVSRTFMTHWDMFWWVLPMWLIGRLFRRHVVGLIAWEVEKNLIRLVNDWTRAVNAAVADVRSQAESWVEAELAMLDQLLSRQQVEAVRFRSWIVRLDELKELKPAISR